MERCIDDLANLARSPIEPVAYFSQLLNSAIDPGGASHARLWHQAVDGKWQLAGGIPPVTDQADFVEHRQTLLTEIALEEHPRIITSSSRDGDPDFNGSRTETCQVFNPIRHAQQTVGILETTREQPGSVPLPTDVIQFFAALCEVTADFLAQHELRQLRRLRTNWQKFDQFSHQLWQSLDMDAVCAVIANDGRLIAETDRVSVLIRRGRSFQLKSVSGIDRVEPRSSATRSLESLASLAAMGGKPVWCQGSPALSREQSAAPQTEIIERHLRDSGATGIGIVPICETNASSPPSAVIIFEQFRPMDRLADWQSSAELLAGRSAPVLRAALERSQIPALRFWLRLRRWPQSLLKPVPLMMLIVLAIAIAALVLIPAEFTVTGAAELWPDHRREVFASTSGIVDRILVAHGDDVARDQPLIVLRDPELESDTPRIIGEIATVNERLKGVQAARLSGGNSADAVSRARQLTAEEEELKERLRTLERQRSLIEERNQALTLRSPIDGKVLTFDVAQHLSARPVDRGQSLLTLGETSGPWIVEVRVADKDAGHLLRARKAIDPQLTVEFMLSSDPGRKYQGQVREISQSSEIDEAGRSHVRVIVQFDRGQLEQPRAGATVLPRIHCGRMSLGYVWLHDLIDAIRTKILF